jgi:hypothetical protein
VPNGKYIRVVICRSRWIEHDPPLVINGEEYEATAEVAEPEVAFIEPTLENFQSIVGGKVEWVHIGAAVGLYANEDAMFEGLPPNRCGILGSFVLTATGRTGRERSLTDEELRKALTWCRLGQGWLHPSITGGDCGPAVTSYDSTEELQAELHARADRTRARWDAL